MNVNVERSFASVDTEFWTQFETDMKETTPNKVYQYCFDNKNYIFSVEKGNQNNKFTLKLTMTQHDNDLSKSIRNKAWAIIEGQHGLILNKQFETVHKGPVIISGDFIC